MKNLRLIHEVTNLDPWGSSTCRVKETLVVTELVDVTVQDRCSLLYMCTLLCQRGIVHAMALEDEEKNNNASY